MRTIPARIQVALAVVVVCGTIAAHAAVGAQAPCPALKLSNKDAKFTGQISSPPNGSLFEVSSGNESALVRYSAAVPVCEGGQATSVNALAMGATVVVYGPEKKKGKVAELDAVEIVVAGNPPTAMRTNEVMSGNNYSRGAGASVNSNPSADPAGGAMPSSAQGTTHGNDSYSQNGKGNAQTGGVSCDSLQFSVKSGADPTGRAGGRTSVSEITCVRPADQTSVQLVQDAVTHRRLPTITLTWHNQIEVTLTNSEISNLQFITDNGNQVVQATFSYQKGEIAHAASGTKTAF